MSVRSPSLCIDETLSCRPGIVDLWYYFYELNDDADLVAAQKVLLNSDERERHRSFLFESHRRLFLATRALVRTVLSNYAPIAPTEWRFEAGHHGKPRVADPPLKAPLYFNLANTPGLVVCVVSLAHELIGIDVERLDRNIDIADPVGD